MIRKLIEAYIWVMGLDGGFSASLAVIAQKEWHRVWYILAFVALYLVLEHRQKQEGLKKGV